MRCEQIVYGFLLTRSGDVQLAEDLTTETFLSVARTAAANPSSMGRLGRSEVVTIAKRRLIDHWRREGPNAGGGIGGERGLCSIMVAGSTISVGPSPMTSRPMRCWRPWTLSRCVDDRSSRCAMWTSTR